MAQGMGITHVESVLMLIVDVCKKDGHQSLSAENVLWGDFQEMLGRALGTIHSDPWWTRLVAFLLKPCGPGASRSIFGDMVSQMESRLDVRRHVP